SGVADFHAGDVAAAEDASFVDAASADAGSGENSHGAPRPLGRAVGVFAVDSSVDVVQHRDGALVSIGQFFADRGVMPAEVDCGVDRARNGIDRAGATDSD